MLRLLSDENFNGDIIRGLFLRQPDLDLVRISINKLINRDRLPPLPKSRHNQK